MSLLLLAVLGLTSTVYATTPVATVQQQAEMSAEGSQLARLQMLEDQLVAAQTKLDAANCPADCRSVAPKPATTASKPKVTPPKSVPVVTVVPVPVSDPRVAELEGLIVVLKAEIKTLEAALDRPVVVNVAAPVVHVAAPAVTVNPLVHTERTTNTVVRTSGFSPIAYAGVDVGIAESYEPVYGTASGRVVGGVRPAWDVGSGAGKFALDIEGNWTPAVQGSGFGVRAVPSIVGGFDGFDLGFGLGTSYDCSVLTGAGCMAEHIGGLARGTVLLGGAFGVRLHGDLEVNYLTVSAQPELRTVLGVDFYVGRRHETTIAQ